ncbi:MAG: hypothetical protein J6A75_06565 [Lachnospiraceae bacterium]|nr:hypothetical protein [Lachnospiraceae bacterium]
MKREDIEKRQTIRFLLLVTAFVIVAGILAGYKAKQAGKISYLEHLDEQIVTIDDKEYPLRALAFYIAHQESSVEKQAKVYDLDNVNTYWNIRSKNSFLRLEAKETAMRMMIHDRIFYAMAKKEGLALTKEEEVYMLNQRMDFWNDLEEEGQERIGVTEGEIEEVFVQMALAQKMQQLLADRQGVDYREYNIEGESYAVLLSEHSYQINERLWERLDFGNITLPPGR